jgi:hypothetical protein
MKNEIGSESSKSGAGNPICTWRAEKGFEEIGSAPESRPEFARPPTVTLRRPEDPGAHDALDHVEDRLLPSNSRSATLSIRPQRSLCVHQARTEGGLTRRGA